MSGLITAAVKRLRVAFATSLGASLVGWAQLYAGAVLRTVADKMRESVSPEDFEDGIGSGLTDATAAVQEAIDAWSNDRSIAIHLPRRYRIDGTLRVGNLETDATETRLIFHGGGTLIKNNAGFMFDKPVGQELQTGHIFFHGTRFEGTGRVGETFILNGDNIIRTHFIACFGVGINIAKAVGYLQTIYCKAGTTWRKWGGYLFDCDHLFDVHWDGIAEAGDAFMITRGAGADPACNALHISGNIEGLSGASGAAIKIGVCWASTITRLYCEKNAGGDIDASGGTSFHKGLTVMGCGFQPTAAQKANPDYYPVITGKGAADAITLIGNASTGNLFDVSVGNESAIVDMGNVVAAGSKKFSATSPRVFSFSGSRFVAMLLPGYGIALDAYHSSVGFENTRSVINGVSVTAEILYGRTNPQLSPGDYSQTQWKRGAVVFNSEPTIVDHQYGAGVVHPSLVLGWCCMSSGAPGVAVFKELYCIQPHE